MGQFYFNRQTAYPSIVSFLRLLIIPRKLFPGRDLFAAAAEIFSRRRRSVVLALVAATPEALLLFGKRLGFALSCQCHDAKDLFSGGTGQESGSFAVTPYLVIYHRRRPLQDALRAAERATGTPAPSPSGWSSHDSIVVFVRYLRFLLLLTLDGKTHVFGTAARSAPVTVYSAAISAIYEMSALTCASGQVRTTSADPDRAAFPYEGGVSELRLSSLFSRYAWTSGYFSLMIMAVPVPCPHANSALRPSVLRPYAAGNQLRARRSSRQDMTGPRDPREAI